MNSLSYKIQEEYGAGFEGTDALRKKYIKDTPGQRIQQFKTEMNQQTYKTYQEFAAQHQKMYPYHNKDQIQAAWETYSKAFEMEEANNLNYIGNCTDDEVVDHIFGDASGFANAVEKYGDDFVLDDLVVKYDPKKDIHSFYYKEQIVKEKSNASMSESWVVYDKNTKAQIKSFKTRKGAMDYAAKSGGVVFSAEYYFDNQDDIKSGKLVEKDSMEESQNLVSKGIYTLDGKKIDGARSSKLFLQGLDADGFLHDLSWKEWSESGLKDTSSDSAKKQFIERLAKQIKMFNKKIDLNTFLKSGNIGFIDTVNYIFKLDPNIKYSKASGLKEDAVQEAVVPKEISQIKTEFDMELIPQSKWARNYQTNVRKVKQLYGISQGNGEYDDVYFVIYDDENKPYGVVDIEGTSMYAKFSDAKAGLKFALNSMSESINIRDYMATSEESKFGGYRPKVVKKSGTLLYLGQASYNTPDEAKDHAEDYLKQYARGISEPRVPSKGSYGLKEEKESYDSWIIKPRDGGKEVKVKAPDETSAIEIALGRKPSQNEIDFFNFHYILIQEKTNVTTLRHMKIVELATKCTDFNLVEAFVEQQYKPQTSALQIKESFRSFVASQKA